MDIADMMEVVSSTFRLRYSQLGDNNIIKRLELR